MAPTIQELRAYLAVNGPQVEEVPDDARLKLAMMKDVGIQYSDRTDRTTVTGAGPPTNVQRWVQANHFKDPTPAEITGDI